MMKHGQILAYVIGLVLCGCNFGGTDVNGADGTGISTMWRTPGVGSFFVDRVIDSENSSASTRLDTFTVVWHGTKDGKSSVTGMLLEIGDTVFLAYEPNGDLSIYREDGQESGWDRFPTGGGSLLDSSVYVDTFSAIHSRSIEYTKYSFSSLENVTIPAGTFPAIKVIGDTWYTRTSSNNVTSTDSNQAEFTLWFVPSLGWIVKDLEKESSSGYLEELVAYKLSWE